MSSSDETNVITGGTESEIQHDAIFLALRVKKKKHPKEYEKLLDVSEIKCLDSSPLGLSRSKGLS